MARPVRPGGIPGIFDKRRPGRPETHGPSARLAIVATATSVPPDGESCWSQAMIARHLGERGLKASRATVGRVLADAHVRPHKVRGWLNRADDPQFWAQAGRVCRLYLHPEPGTVLISVDEKTGIQAKTRIRPDIPARPGQDARREFEYKRHGTVSIIAAMNVATGEVISQRVCRNDSVTFMKFLSMLDQHIAPGLRIRLIMDNGLVTVEGDPGLDRRPSPVLGDFYPEACIVAEHGGAVVQHPDQETPAPRHFASQEDLENQITEFTIGYNKTAHRWKWRYDADAEHARYLERH